MTLENHGNSVTNEMEALYKHRTTLTQIFNTIDKDKSGFISREEFIEACKVSAAMRIICYEIEDNSYTTKGDNNYTNSSIKLMMIMNNSVSKNSRPSHSEG